MFFFPLYSPAFSFSIFRQKLHHMANMFFIVETNGYIFVFCVRVYFFFLFRFIYSIWYNNEIDARKGLKGHKIRDFDCADLRARKMFQAHNRFYYRILYTHPFWKCTHTKAILFRFHFYDSPDIDVDSSMILSLKFRLLTLLPRLLWYRRSGDKLIPLRAGWAGFWVRNGNWCLFRQTTGRYNWREKKKENSIA